VYPKAGLDVMVNRKISGLSRDSSVGIATRLRVGLPRFDSRKKQDVFSSP
jgi:hypothetical protein